MKTDLKTIDAMISSITKRGKALRTDCHSCLVAVLEHHSEHGDYTRLPKLLEAVMGSLGSSLSAAMIDWTKRFYDGLSFDMESKKFVHVKVKGAIRDVTADDKIKLKSSPADSNTFFIGNARELPFYELERIVKQEPFDLQAAILSLVKRAKSAYEANITKHAHNHVNAGQIKVLENIAKNIVDVTDADLEAPAPLVTAAEKPAKRTANTNKPARKPVQAAA